ncbi:MAG: YncE family protein [Myxococcota bacterium]|nr:YncE family protein [Myxococcota bacterium]
MSARARSRLALTISALAVIAASASPGAGQDAASDRSPSGDAGDHFGTATQVEPFHTRHGGPRLEVVARVRTGVLPKSVSVSPDGTRLAVCNFGRPDAESVFLYDAATMRRTAVIEFAGNAVESVWSSDGATLYVSNFRRGVVEVIDVASATVRAEITTGVHPKFMVLSPDDATLYVANYGDWSVSVVDVAQGREVRRLATERQPRGLALREDGTLLAAAFRGDVVHAFAAGTPREASRWETCEMPRHLLLSPDDATMFVTCSLGTIGFYDARTGRRFGTALTGRNPRTIARNGDGRWVGVANFSSSDVTLVDTVGRRHRNYDVPGASGIVGLAMDPGPAPRLYATSWDTGHLFVLAERAPE